MFRRLFLFFILNGALIFQAQSQISDSDGIFMLFEKATSYKESGKADSAKIFLNSAIDLVNSSVELERQPKILLEKAKEFEIKGYYSFALILYLETISHSIRTNQERERGLSLLGLSNINFRIGNYEHALENSMDAIEIFNNKDTSNYIKANMLMSQVYIIIEQYDEALSIYKRMLEIAREKNDSVLIADNLDHIGAVFSLKKQYGLALPFHEQALKINKEIKNNLNQSINCANIGEVYLRLKDYEKAERNLNEGLKLAEEADFRSLEIFIYYTMGELYSLTNQNKKAIDSFNLSLELIDELSELYEKPKVYLLLSEHYERYQDFEHAIHFYKKYSVVYDSLNVQNAKFRTEELKVSFEINKREQEVKSLELEKQLQQRELRISKDTIKFQYITIILIIVGFVFSVLFTLYFYRSQRRLRNANHTKDVLFSIIGHDLKGPVGNIKKLIEIAGESGIEEQKKILKMMKRPADASYSLLNELLDWSRSINNNITYSPELIDLNNILQKALDMFDAQINEKSISVKINLSREYVVFADTMQVQTILRNLISNAIKFTHYEGSIEIEVLEEHNMVKTIIKDTGVGIEPDNIKKILDKNTIFSTYGTNKEKGSGLGTLLCIEFVKINGGVFDVKSTVGVGSTFSFTLPKG